MKVPSLIIRVIVVTGFVCIACKGEYLEDPLDPRYIMYTESGKGAAGASINGQQWKSVVTTGWIFGGSNYPVLYCIPGNDSIEIILEGSMTNSEVYTSIVFRLSGVHIDSEDDIVRLDGTKFTLDGVNHFGMVSPFDDFYQYPLTPSPEYTGQIYFRSVTSENFSGTFYIKDEAMEVYYGRFDYHFDHLDFVFF